jgi:hypothetical protein
MKKLIQTPIPAEGNFVSCPQEKIGIGPFEKNCKGKEYLNHVH